MDGKVLPQFKSLPDRLAAEAFSEFYLRAADFKVAAASQSGSAPRFPPEPAYMTAILAAYIDERTGKLGPRRQMYLSESGHVPESVIAQVFEERYRSQVGLFQAITERLDDDPVLVAGKSFFITRAAASNLRTVASFVLATSSDGKRHHSALLVPRATYEELPFQDREQLLEVMDLFQETGFKMMDHLSEPQRAAFREILTHDPIHHNWVFTVGASFLPDPDTVAQGLVPYMGTTETGRNPEEGFGRNRARE